MWSRSLWPESVQKISWLWPISRWYSQQWGIHGQPYRGALGGGHLSIAPLVRKHLSLNFIVLLTFCPDVTTKLVLWLDSKIIIGYLCSYLVNFGYVKIFLVVLKLFLHFCLSMYEENLKIWIFHLLCQSYLRMRISRSNYSGMEIWGQRES